MKKKNLIKEIFILILLLILIMLILAVALYDFIPSDITIPDEITYSSDSVTTSIKQEIAYTNGGDITADQSEAELVTSLKSYSITSSDLAVYEQKGVYDKANSNPFDYAEEPAPETTTTDQSTTTNTTNTTTSQTSTPAQTNQTSSGTFFEKPNSK